MKVLLLCPAPLFIQNYLLSSSSELVEYFTEIQNPLEKFDVVVSNHHLDVPDIVPNIRKSLQPNGLWLSLIPLKERMSVINLNKRILQESSSILLFLKTQGFNLETSFPRFLVWKRFIPTSEERVGFFANQLLLPTNYFNYCYSTLQNSISWKDLLEFLQNYSKGTPLNRWELDSLREGMIGLFPKTTLITTTDRDQILTIPGAIWEHVHFAIPKGQKRKIQSWLFSCVEEKLDENVAHSKSLT